MNSYATLDGTFQDGSSRRVDPELIALAVAISLFCGGRINVRATEARKLGVTEQEIEEAPGVAVSIYAGAAVDCSARSRNAFKAAGPMKMRRNEFNLRPISVLPGQ